jgi:TetR/AcrR family transcriptional regulator, mexJK operon transcriptional repressor
MRTSPREPVDDTTLDPRVARSRAVIVAAAYEHFLRNGYLGANVDQIAAEARVSKRTVYNIFGGKEQLFLEILSEAITVAEQFSQELISLFTDTEDVATEEVETTLRTVGVRLARAVLSGRIVRLRRLLIGEAERFPDHARDYYERGPGRVMDTLATVLSRFHDRGLLQIEDARIAAEHFAFLVLGAPLDRALFIIDSEPSSTEDIERYARKGVEVFVHAYPAQH